MLFIILSVIAYLAIGTMIARKTYALAVHESESLDREAVIKAGNDSLNQIPHSNDCWRGPRFRSSVEPCDCRNKWVWQKMNRQIERLESGKLLAPSPYPILLAWPAIGFHKFLTGGKVSSPTRLHPVDWEKKMERELGIGS